MADFDRKDWLRALRTMSDDYILTLLDQAMDAARAQAWDEACEHDIATCRNGCSYNPYRSIRGDDVASEERP